MGFIHKISQLAGLGDIVNGIVGGLGDFIETLINGYLSLFANFFYTIFLGFATLLDVIQLLFRKLAGLEYYVVNGVETTETRDLALEIINNQVIMNIFWSMVILGGVLLIVSTFIAVIKSEYQPLEGKAANSKGKIIGKALRSVITMATVPVVAIAALYVGNALLNSLDMATSSGGDSNLSGRIFAAAAFEANRAREGVGAYDEEFLNKLETTNNFGVFIETDTGFIVETVADKIDNAFQNNLVVATGQTVDFSNHDNNILAWLYNKIGEPEYPESFSIYNYRLIWYYYDINNFNFFIGIGVAIMLLAVLLQTMLGLIKRIYAIVLLFIVAPPIIAITPINEDAYKNWKKEFIKSTLSAYAVIVTMNIYIMLIPVFSQIDFFQIDDTMSQTLQVLYMSFNLLSQLFILIGGAVFFKDFSKTLAGIIGAEDAFGEGAGKSKDFVEKATKAGALAMGIGGLPNKVFSGGKAIQGFRDAKKSGQGNWASIGSGLSSGANLKGIKSGVKDFFTRDRDDDGNKLGFLKDKVQKVQKGTKESLFFQNLTGGIFHGKTAAASKMDEKKKTKNLQKTEAKRSEDILKAIKGIPGQIDGEEERAKSAAIAADTQLTKDYLKNQTQDQTKLLEGDISADGTSDGTGLLASLQVDQDKLKVLKNERRYARVPFDKAARDYEIDKQNTLIKEKTAKIETAQNTIAGIKKQIDDLNAYRQKSQLTIDQIIAKGKEIKEKNIVDTANALKGLSKQATEQYNKDNKE